MSSSGSLHFKRKHFQIAPMFLKQGGHCCGPTSAWVPSRGSLPVNRFFLAPGTVVVQKLGRVAADHHLQEVKTFLARLSALGASPGRSPSVGKRVTLNQAILHLLWPKPHSKSIEQVRLFSSFCDSTRLGPTDLIDMKPMNDLLVP